MSQPLAITVQPSAAQTASGNGSAYDLNTLDGKRRAIADLTLKVTAASGTGGPTLTVSAQTSPDGVAWRTLGTFNAVSATGYQRLRFGPCDRYVRASWVITGTTPSFTFDLAGYSHVTYADPDDFALYGLPTAATSKLSTDAICAALLAGCSEVDGYIPKRYLLPLVEPYPEILRQRVCEVGAMTVMSVRGFKPDSTMDRVIAQRWQNAISWLKEMAKGNIEPPWADASPGTDEGAPVIETDDPMWPTVELSTANDPFDPTTW